MNHFKNSEAESETPAGAVPSKLEETRAAAAAALEGKEDNERGAIKDAAADLKFSKLMAASEKLSIKNTLEIVDFGVALAEAIEKSKADGHIGIEDIGNLFPVAPLVLPMINDIGMVPKELGDLDEEELEVLLADASKLLDGASNAQTVLKVKAALKFAHAGYDLYQAFAK